MSSEKYTLVEGGILVETELAENVSEPYQLFLDATVVRRAKDREEQEAKTRQILEYLDESNIGHNKILEYQGSDLEIQIGFERRGYGVFGMTAEILRPTVSDREASHIATEGMQQMARNLGIYSDNQIPGMVYAFISQEQGMVFETNPAGACSMDTDGMEYDPMSERISLNSHNLYTHEMQLICISGLIALAKAR